MLRFALLSLGVGRDAMPPVSSCADGTAYASLLSFHDSNETSTQLAGMVATTSDFACHDPSKTGCEITLPVLPNLTEELWGF